MSVTHLAVPICHIFVLKSFVMHYQTAITYVICDALHYRKYELKYGIYLSI